MCSDRASTPGEPHWAVQATGLGKCYGLYDQPTDRLKQLLFGRWRQYGRDFWAVRDVDLRIAHGEVIGVVGRNGAGKSTLLQMICGTLEPSAGSLKIDGRVAVLLELGAGFNPEFTGIENVFMNGALLGLNRRQIDERLEQILDFAQIGEFAHQRVKTYSSGMFMRLAFAVATSVEPDILIVDEALAVGDGAFARKSFDRIMQMKQAGCTILFCSHSMYQVEALCSRAIWLEQGQVQMIDSAQRVAQAYHASLGISDEAVEQSQLATVAAAPIGGGHIVSAHASSDGQRGRHVQLRSGESDLTIEIEFAIDPKLPAPGIALGIADSHGQTISSATSVHDGAQILVRSDGTGSAAVTFRRVPLFKGEYSVTLFLCTEDALHAYDQVEQAVRFTVSQGGPEQGLVHLPHDWASGGRGKTG